MRKGSLRATPRIVMCFAFIMLTSAPDYVRAETWYPPTHAWEDGVQQHNQTDILNAAKARVIHTHRKAVSSSDLNPLVQGVRFFQRFISPVDSPRCPMYPTCSTYALQALQRHGPVLGSFITVDRLLHESSPEEQNIPLQGFGRTRYYDPLDANDFWLDSAKANTKDEF
ncbi:MAG: membrane protein insertion efficiency factor YidD [Thermodesulfobacteriota bacterium]